LARSPRMEASRAIAWARSICLIPAVTLLFATLMQKKHYGSWRIGRSKAESIGPGSAGSFPNAGDYQRHRLAVRMKHEVVRQSNSQSPAGRAPTILCSICRSPPSGRCPKSAINKRNAARPLFPCSICFAFRADLYRKALELRQVFIQRQQTDAGPRTRVNDI